LFPFTLCRSPFSNLNTRWHENERELSTVDVNGQRRLGQFTPRIKKFFTESVENPVEKIRENRIALRQSERFSGLHYRGAIDDRVNGVDKKSKDYTVVTP